MCVCGCCSGVGCCNGVSHIGLVVDMVVGMVVVAVVGYYGIVNVLVG